MNRCDCHRRLTIPTSHTLARDREGSPSAVGARERVMQTAEAQLGDHRDRRDLGPRARANNRQRLARGCGRAPEVHRAIQHRELNRERVRSQALVGSAGGSGSTRALSPALPLLCLMERLKLVSPAHGQVAPKTPPAGNGVVTREKDPFAGQFDVRDGLRGSTAAHSRARRSAPKAALLSPRFAGPLSPAPDSNRRPLPYHLVSASPRNRSIERFCT